MENHPTHDEIAEVAYQVWQLRTGGRDLDQPEWLRQNEAVQDWLIAENVLLERART